MPARTDLNKPAAMLGQPEPPAAYSAAEKTIWKAVVTSRPASAWTPADLVLIGLYVSAVADVQRLDREIDRHGEIEAGKVSPLVKLRDMRETRLIQVAARLKLLPSNRYDAKTVARLGQHASKAGRALATMEADDLLGGAPTKGRLQ